MQFSQIFYSNTFCATTDSEPTMTNTMTRSAHGSRYIHHRRGSGDSFNEKYASSPLISQRALGACLPPLTRSTSEGNLDLSGENDFQVFQRRHTVSTVASSFLKQPSLHSIGEMDTYNDDDSDSLSFYGDIVDVQKRNVNHSSLRSASASIRSLPREIELLNEDGEEDGFSMLSGDEECMRSNPAPSMLDLQDSLRSIDTSILTLPREQELMEDEKRFSFRREAVAKKRVSFASSKMNTYCCQQRNWQSWNDSSEEISQLRLNLLEMHKKVESMAALIASMGVNKMKDHPSPPRTSSRKHFQKRENVARSA